MNEDWEVPRELRIDAPTYSIHAHAAALYVAFLRAGELDAAAEFAEWYLETFDHDLED